MWESLNFSYTNNASFPVFSWISLMSINTFLISCKGFPVEESKYSSYFLCITNFPNLIYFQILIKSCKAFPSVESEYSYFVLQWVFPYDWLTSIQTLIKYHKAFLSSKVNISILFYHKFSLWYIHSDLDGVSYSISQEKSLNIHTFAFILNFPHDKYIHTFLKSLKQFPVAEHEHSCFPLLFDFSLHKKVFS